MKTTFELINEVYADIKAGLQDTQGKLDAIVIHPYVDPMIEVRRLCNEHREAMRCNILT